MKLGKAPKRHDPRTLRMTRYIDKLPTPPPKVDHASLLPADIGMMGNDKYGDCAVAAPAHMVQSWTTYAERGTQTIPDTQILAAYKVLSPQDQGCVMLDVLNYWRKTGIGGDNIEGYVEIGVADLNHARFAIQYFGSCLIGMALPDVNTFGPWEIPTGPANQNNGHAVTLLAYDDTAQMFKVATWGKIMNLSYAWFKKYCDEGYAVLNDIELLKATGKSPEGFDFATLQDDLKHIGDAVIPAPVPVASNVFQVAVTALGHLCLKNRADIKAVNAGDFYVVLQVTP